MGRFNLFQLTALSLLSVSVLTGCNEPETPQTEVQLSTDTVDVPAEGGTMNVGYTVSNPAEGAYWSVPSESELEWISDFDFSEEGVIKFNVDTNDSATQREEEVVLEYSSIPGQTFSFLVRQQGNSDTEPFTVEMTQINYVDATARITPADPEMTYLSMVYTEEYFKTLGDDDEIVQTIINELSFIAGMGGMSVEEFISEYYLMTGTGEYYYDMLYLESSHCIYVVGLTPELQRTTKGVTKYFMTSPVDKIDVSFELKAEVNGPNVTITTTPSDNDIRYWSSICLKSEYDGNIQNGLNNEFWRGSVSGKTKGEVLEQLTDTGISVKDTTLQHNTEYVAFAAAVNDDGIVCSEPNHIEFTTEDIAMSDLTFEMTVTNISPSSADITIIPSNDEDMYTFNVIPASEYEGLSDGEILDKYLENNMFQALMSNRSGKLESLTYDSLLPDTEYYLIAFGFFQEIVTTGLSKTAFKTTTPGNDFESLEINISIVEYTAKSITASFSPSSESILYFNGTCPAGATEESIRADVDETINRWIEGGYAGVTCPLDFYRIYGFRGSYEFEYTGLGDYSQYQIFAVGVSENADTEGQLASTMYFSEVVTLSTEESAQKSPDSNSLKLTFAERSAEKKGPQQKHIADDTFATKTSCTPPIIRIGKPVAQL